jgi:16S rRNA (uracil1498-N3)-methyltransferase
MSARLHIDPPPAGVALAAGAELLLPASASRHVQVLRLQPGQQITLFDGRGGEWLAEILAMDRKTVSARVIAHLAVERELSTEVTLALGMPANERMDSLVEKATELGLSCLQPLVCERSVLRLVGERAERKTAHWQAIAVSACEQSGRNRVPKVALPMSLRDWLAAQAGSVSRRLLLSLAPNALPLAQRLTTATAITALSGPEGGLSTAEVALAERCGFLPISLGARVLRADTAPLALLACIAALETP